jgi:hypothetical protein
VNPNRSAARRHHDVSRARQELDQSTGEYLVTKDNVGAIATLEKYDPEYQKKRVMVRPGFGKR